VLAFGTAGCNPACRFCQNWDISKSREIDTLSDAAGPEELVRAAASLGCRSVAFTYNDPVIFMEYAIDVAQACRELGIKSVAITAGYMRPQPRVEFYRHMGRGQRRSQGVHRGLLPSRLRRAAGAGAGDARVPQARDRGMVRPDPTVAGTTASQAADGRLRGPREGSHDHRHPHHQDDEYA